MTKHEITLPKGYECKDGLCLDKDVSFDFEIPELKPQIRNIPQARINGIETNQLMETITPQKENIIEKLIKVVPSYQPNFVCKDDKCSIKKNPNYNQRITGKCSKCGQFTKQGQTVCHWCKNNEIEEIEEEELDNLGIPMPDISEENLEAD